MNINQTWIPKESRESKQTIHLLMKTNTELETLELANEKN